MDMILKRDAWRSDGIFSQFMDDHGNTLFWTLEHAFKQPNGNYLPKIPDGLYQCVRGMHRLEGMDSDFETFEITGVEGHTGLLFHIGNYNMDSDGCVLVGTDISKLSTFWMITNSRAAFESFMSLHADDQTFSLVVSST